MVPQLKRTMKQVEDSLNNVQTKGMVSKVQQAVQQVKQKVNEVKNTGVDKQLQSQFDRAGASVERYQGQLEETKQKLRQVYAEMDNIQATTWKAYTPEGVDLGNKAIEPAVNKDLGSNKQYQGLSKEATKLEQKMASINSKLNATKQQYSQISNQIQQTASKNNVWSSAVDKAKNAVTGVRKNISSAGNAFKSVANMSDKVKNSCNQILKVSTKVVNKVKQMGTGMKQGLGNVLKYAGALFSLQSIYSALSGAANSWLSSQNAGAQQLSTNIEYLKNSFGSVLAPAIELVTNLVYKLMKAIQSVVYALTGVNIFANASAKAYGDMASSASDASKSAKEQNKQLAGVHDEINNVNSSNASAGSGGGGGAGGMTPSFDLSTIDSQLVSWMNSIKEKLETLFEPILNAWNNYGATMIESAKTALNSVWKLIKSIGKSFEEVWLNGTGEQTISLILQILTSVFNIISNIADAWRRAWENNGNGTAIVQNLWNALNNILEIILSIVQAYEEWTESDSFQTFANSIIEVFKTLSSWIEIITEKLKEIWENGGEETFTKLLEFISKLTEAISAILEFLSPIIEYILEIVTPVISGIITAIGYVIDALSGVLDFIIGIFTGDWERAWQGLGDFFEGIWNALKTLVETIWNAISTILSDAWNGIKTIATNIWNGIKDFFSNIWNSIKTTVSNAINNVKTTISDVFNSIKNTISNIWNNITSTISNVINKIKTTISNVLNTIKTNWNNIWNGIKTTVTNIWNGIWNAIKSVINSILGGIESFVNGVINGINFVLRGISSVANAAGSLIGLDPINLQLNTISLPRLAKGAVLKVPTVAEMAEYPGASQNPEIVTPQNIMEETFDRVLSRYQGNNNQSICLTVRVGNEKLGQILLNDLRNMKRRSGKGIEALVGN